MVTRSKSSASTHKVADLISKAFTDAQRTSAAHPRAISLLISAYHLSPKHFLHHFIHALNRILVVFSRDANVERLVQFVGSFVSSEISEEGNFCSVILKYTLAHTNCRTPAVRFRTVQLMATILCKLPESAELSDDLLDQINETVIDRAIDRVPRVRAAAAGALCRMQSDGNPETDDCTAILLKMMTADSSASVRKAAIQAIAINNHTVPFIVSRVQDVNGEVRRMVFDTLAKKNLNPFELDRHDIIFLLRNGLQDPVKAVRDACQNKLLLQSWMTQACDGNVFDLVDLLGCHDDETIVLNALKVIFQSEEFSQLVDSVHIDVNNLSGDDVLILRGMCEARRFDGGLDRFIQTTSDYANILSYYAIDPVASKHLLELCKCLDLADEAGRRNLQNVLCSSFLKSPHVENDVIGNAIRALRRALTEDEDCARLLCDVVQDVLTIENDQHPQDPDSCDDNPDHVIDENWKTLRALKICCEALRSVPLKSPRISSLFTTYGNLLNMVRLELSEDEEIRQLSFECISLYCLLDKTGDEARANVPILFTAAMKDIDGIQDLSLRALTDITLLHGLPDGDFPIALSTTPESGEDQDSSKVTSYSQAFDILFDRIFHGDWESRTLAVQCLAKLLYTGRLIPSTKLLCRLLVVYHSPSTEGDDQLRQCLSLYFPGFASKPGSNRLHWTTVPARRILLEAPETSELNNVSPVKVGQFVHSPAGPQMGTGVSAQTSGEIDRPADMIQERLAEYFLREMIESWDDDMKKVYSKILSSFRFTCVEANRDKLEGLRKLAKRAIVESEDRWLKKQLSKFVERLECDLEQYETESVENVEEG